MHDTPFSPAPHVALPPAPSPSAEVARVQAILERSRAWTRAPSPKALFGQVAQDIQGLLHVDAGYFVYRPSRTANAPLSVYAPWGALRAHVDTLQLRVRAQASATEMPLQHLSERWLGLDQVPAPVRADWQRWGFTSGGSWPITLQDRRLGAVVLRRLHPVTPDDAPLVSLFALQLSLMLEIQELRQEAEFLSERDPLTGLYNRRGLQSRLPALERLARETSQAVLLTVVDVDGLKVVNDRSGHPEGDRLLQSVAETLRAHVRHTDLVARIGGDEFAVVQILDPENEPAAVRRLDAVLHVAGDGWQATAGHALLGRDGADWEACYAYADRQLYQQRASRLAP